MSDWTTISDVKGFLAAKGTRVTKEHAFKKRVAHWPYCQYCGLVQLKNEPSRKAAKGKCVTYE